MDVEPVIANVQVQFGVTLSDDRDRLPTVGDLYLYLLNRSRPSGDAPCPTSHAFNQVRRLLTSEFPLRRDQVRPEARLCDLFPAATRDSDWLWLRNALGLSDLPELARRRVPTMRAFRIWLTGVTAVWWIICPVLSLADGKEFSLSYGLLIWFLLVLLVCEWFGIFWIVMAQDYLERTGRQRVRDIVVPLAVQQARQSAGQDAAPQQLWDDMAAIIAAEAAVPVREVYSWQSWGDLPDYL